jgi:hypothetical protein
VLVYLDGDWLPSQIYQQYALATLDGQLIAVIEREAANLMAMRLGKRRRDLHVRSGRRAPVCRHGDHVAFLPNWVKGLIVIRFGGPGGIAEGDHVMTLRAFSVG